MILSRRRASQMEQDEKCIAKNITDDIAKDMVKDGAKDIAKDDAE